MKHTLVLFFATCSLVFSLSAWPDSTKEAVLELRIQVEEIQNDLLEIKNLLKEIKDAPAPSAAAPSAAAGGFREQVVSVGSSPYKGKADATVTMMEFSDYDCPFCARHYREVMPTLIEEYVDTGKLKFVMRENPIPSLHPDATNASMAALCAGDQDKYWEMHDMLFENQRALNVDNLKAFAGTLELDTSEFNECLDSKKFQKQIASDISSGGRLGVRGTPGFVLGLTDPKDSDKANMTVFVRGAKSLDEFKYEIDSLLESAE